MTKEWETMRCQAFIPSSHYPLLGRREGLVREQRLAKRANGWAKEWRVFHHITSPANSSLSLQSIPLSYLFLSLMYNPEITTRGDMNGLERRAISLYITSRFLAVPFHISWSFPTLSRHLVNDKDIGNKQIGKRRRDDKRKDRNKRNTRKK